MTFNKQISIFSVPLFLLGAFSLQGCAELWKSPTPDTPPEDIVVDTADSLTDAVQKFNNLEATTNACSGFQLDAETVRKSIDDNWALIPTQFQDSFRDIHSGQFKSGTMSLAGFHHCQYLRVIVRDATADVHGNILAHSLSLGEDHVR